MKSEFVTKKYLDKKLTEHSKIIVAAVDQILDKRLGKMEERIKKDINNVQSLIDGYVKAQEEFKEEFVIIKEEVKKIKEVIKQKLGIEIRVA